MIEFKAECGHTVRAKDEDAGGVVRCSYCGKPANVPENTGDDLEFLFDDVQQTDEVGRKRKRSGRGLFAKRKRRPGEFNPFPIVLRLCYAALLIIIVVVVSRKWLFNVISEAPDWFKRTQGRVVREETPDNLQQREDRTADGRRRYGLVGIEIKKGLYVSSVPPGATVYCVKSSNAPPARGRIHRTGGGCEPFRTNASKQNLPAGEYVVEVVFPWNDKKLTDYPGYTDFRRRIQRASAKERTKLLANYFVPDEASDVFVDETRDQIYFVRQYRHIDVQKTRAIGVHALFLPKRFKEDGRSFSTEEFVKYCHAATGTYAFDEQYILSELEFHRVDESDHAFILAALSRVGVVPYVTPDQGIRMFKIDIHDGQFLSPAIAEPN